MKRTRASKALPPARREALLKTLQDRFEANPNRHDGLAWADVRARLTAAPDKLWSLHEMERTGGEPDVIGLDPDTGQYLFADCSPQTPKGRVSLCYDGPALRARKEHKPQGSAVETAQAMGIELLDEAQYRRLQSLGEFDTTTSSWVKTPPDIRALGGALFCDRRYGHVFVYHNGAQSYYAARAFRGLLKL
ncbi:MAG: DUF4256 domain-containing protein [Planctomycetes bacterium]|jgi:hypothetical protein|nr:DUF4256 domain-containing protein [Planctomycetota bacterium]MCL4730612.1 DUF4256 domain-containing protein [Planctomycetota bacterium]